MKGVPANRDFPTWSPGSESDEADRMMRRLSIILVAPIFFIAVIGCSGDDDEVLGIVVTEAETTEEIALAADERFEVRLASTPSTGYRWEMSTMTTGGIVELESRTFEEPEEAQIVGAAGTDVLVFRAAEAGAGVLRLEYVRAFDDPPVPERVVEYIVRIDGAPWPPDRDDVDPPRTATATAPPVQSSIDVATLIRGGESDAVAAGPIVWDAGGARLCEVLMESYPPQCGGEWVVIANPERLTVELESAAGVRWTQSWVEIAGRYDGSRFIVDFPDLTLGLTADEQALADAFVAFAAAPTEATHAELPLAETVALGLGAETLVTAASDQLADPAFWMLERDEFRGWSGPFSALEFSEAPVVQTIGAHARCVAPPEPAPAGFESYRRLSLQPADADGCLEWWTIDFFLDAQGEIGAVTLDLFAP